MYIASELNGTNLDINPPKICPTDEEVWYAMRILYTVEAITKYETHHRIEMKRASINNSYDNSAKNICTDEPIIEHGRIPRSNERQEIYKQECQYLLLFTFKTADMK